MDKVGYSRRRLSCFAALLLLAQLPLAAAHVHMGGPHRLPLTASASHETGGTPAGPLHSGGEFCPLCCMQTVAGSLLVPPPVELRIPARIDSVQFASLHRPAAERTAPNAFRPRAPPARRYARRRVVPAEALASERHKTIRPNGCA